ncbi:hypothetical protein KY362_06785 [Candidatus Woesearchaeota archaeon]|nr:hypothetical protein [Candidatus Woesearchaeota archaeon]
MKQERWRKAALRTIYTQVRFVEEQRQILKDLIHELNRISVRIGADAPLRLMNDADKIGVEKFLHKSMKAESHRFNASLEFKKAFEHMKEDLITPVLVTYNRDVVQDYDVDDKRLQSFLDGSKSALWKLCGGGNFPGSKGRPLPATPASVIQFIQEAVISHTIIPYIATLDKARAILHASNIFTTSLRVRLPLRRRGGLGRTVYILDSGFLVDMYFERRSSGAAGYIISLPGEVVLLREVYAECKGSLLRKGRIDSALLDHLMREVKKGNITYEPAGVSRAEENAVIRAWQDPPHDPAAVLSDLRAGADIPVLAYAWRHAQHGRRVVILHNDRKDMLNTIVTLNNTPGNYVTAAHPMRRHDIDELMFRHMNYRVA